MTTHAKPVGIMQGTIQLRFTVPTYTQESGCELDFAQSTELRSYARSAIDDLLTTRWSGDSGRVLIGDRSVTMSLEDGRGQHIIVRSRSDL